MNFLGIVFRPSARDAATWAPLAGANALIGSAAAFLFATMSLAVLSAGTAHAQATPANPPCPSNVTNQQFANPSVVSVTPPHGTMPISTPPAVLTLIDELQLMPISTGGGTPTCSQQRVRIFKAGIQPPTPPSVQQIAVPQAGPTLRARIGDVVQLAFINQVNSSRFDRNIDIDACMTVGKDGSIYPAAEGDKAPNCLHASSSGNLHFHGTHTNPNGTGDNVYLTVRPLPRNNQGALTVTTAEVTKGFDSFFGTCTQDLQNPTNLWPALWSDLPSATRQGWLAKQQSMLIAYDQDPRTPPNQQLWQKDVTVKDHLWPQYYIGAVPYCFALPNKPIDQAISDGALRMGQAPGTHWYHAHKHGSTAINVENGMSGVFIIEGEYDDTLNAAYNQYVPKDQQPWTRSQPVMLLNQIGTTPGILTQAGNGAAGTTDFAVNGQLRPFMSMKPGEIKLWRIVNSSGRNAVYFLPPPANFHWMQTAQDGVQLAQSRYKASKDQPFYLAPGNRVDLLVQAPSTPVAGVPVNVQLVMGRAALNPAAKNPPASVPLMTINVGPSQPSLGMPFLNDQPPGTPPNPPNGAAYPTQPKFLTDITDQEWMRSGSPTKELVFASTPSATGAGNIHTINGYQFSEGGNSEVDVFLGNTEQWKIVNTTYANNKPTVLGGTGVIDHPFHIHVNPFQILEVFDPNELLPNPDGTPSSTPRYVVATTANPNPPYNAATQCVINANDKTTWSVAGACKPQPGTPVPPPPTNLVWWDTFAIPTALGVATSDPKNPIVIPGYFIMRSRFVDYPGFYVLHCHILIHEDRGMMFSVSVSKKPMLMMSHH